MKKAIRIRTISQWHLLQQINNYLGKKKIPEEVMRRIYHILCSKKLGKDDFLIVCLDKIKDDYQGIEDVVGMYPNKIRVEEEMDEILTRGKKGKVRGWYVSYISLKRQKIQLIYTTKDQSDYRRDGD
ncbi:MAG: hypothetical protein K2L07_07015 [Lachnospiraceae bacterium]|nr:hypothetical protein [Lachnospiraceae bacterium]